MYDYIIGKIDSISLTNVVIETAGVGYFINISLQSHTELNELKEAKLFIHQYQVRDDLPVLFGFFSRSERDIFRMLIGVSGVGGGTARNILSTFSTQELQHIISTGESRVLKGVKGLGQKTAEKLIIELRDKIITIDMGERQGPSGSFTEQGGQLFEEALSALTMLGFSKAASSKALSSVIAENPNDKVEDIVRKSLKKL